MYCKLGLSKHRHSYTFSVLDTWTLDSTLRGSTLSWTQWTALSGTLRCPGQHSAGLCAVLDSTQRDSVLPWTALSRTLCCPGQHSAGLCAVLDSTQRDSVLPWTALSRTLCCPGQHSAGLCAVLNSTLRDSALS